MKRNVYTDIAQSSCRTATKINLKSEKEDRLPKKRTVSTLMAKFSITTIKTKGEKGGIIS